MTSANAPAPAALANPADFPASPETRDAATAVLRRLTGRDDAEFRDGQLEAIAALVDHKQRALVVQRTGWGKSAVYFVATSLMRAAGRGPTLLISPLLSLMRDQIAAAERAGVRALSIDSTNTQMWDELEQRIHDDAVDVVLVSPERLANNTFRERTLPKILAGAGLVVVDEAHCVSDWGHDFRPDYLGIRNLLHQLPAQHPVLATTATANDRVTVDVRDQLSTGGVPVVVFRGGLARKSLRLGVLRLPGSSAQLAWLMTNLASLPGSGIVYAQTVAAAEDMATALRSAGHNVEAYTGRTEAADRERLEAALKDNDVKALIATSALGMGFDKPDLGFVVHVGSPSSPIAYYQQVGRAGRATDSADVLLLPTSADARLWEYFATASMPVEADCYAMLEALRTADKPVSVPQLMTHTGSKRGLVEVMLKTLAVEGVVAKEGKGWVHLGKDWAYDAAKYTKVAEARTHEQNLMRQFQQLTTCRMAFLQQCLDDPDATYCGRCDNCAGVWFSTDVPEDASAGATAALRDAAVMIDSRKQWPTGMAGLGIPVKGKIPETERFVDGRALTRLSDLRWGGKVSELLAEDQPAPAWLLDALAGILKNWQWDARPTAIMGMPGGSHPVLVASIVDQLGTAGRWVKLPPVADTNPDVPARFDVNSAFALQDAWRRYQVPAVTECAEIPDVVLLVDALFATGWPFAVVARQLRQAGAGAVLPFAVAQSG